MVAFDPKDVADTIAYRKQCKMTRKEFHACLVKLREHIKKHGEPPASYLGICYNATLIDNKGRSVEIINTLAYYAMDWPKHSGIMVYPVKPSTSRKWDNPDRHELLNYLIRKTR